MKRNLAVLAGTGLGAAVAFLLRRRTRTEPGAAPTADPRADDLRRKLVQARERAAEEEDFEAAGIGAEVIVREEPGAEEAAARARDDVEEARRRVHEEGRRAADEMRRASEADEPER